MLLAVSANGKAWYLFLKEEEATLMLLAADFGPAPLNIERLFE